MKCQVINLDRSVDRLAHITSEFARIGVPFDRVSAVEGAAEISVNAAPRLTKPEIGCFLSHRKCWQAVASGSDAYGAIFEDDVIFADNAATLLEDDSWIPRDADIVKLETFFVPVRLGRRSVDAGAGHSLVKLVGRHVGSAGYILSQDAARRLLRRTRRLNAAVDNVLFCPTMPTCSRNTIYQMLPALCVQNNFVSENAIQTLMQTNQSDHQKSFGEKVVAEASRVYAHFRNRTFWGTQKVDSVPFGSD